MSDVCLLLEGTFPYVSGGVSTWIYNIIKSLPNITFSILLISPYRDDAREYKYPIPENVVNINEIYIHDYRENNFNLNKNKNNWKQIYNFYKNIWNNNYNDFEEIVEIFSNPDTKSMDWKTFFFSKKSFDYLIKFYKKHNKEYSFIDYFWTWRFTHLPLYNVLTAKIPKALTYHAISTGYAGLLGSIAKIIYNKPLLLTEHGIYTNERKIEITTADWIYNDSQDNFSIQIQQPFFKQWWINLFSFLSKITYKYSDEIITLYLGNQKLQIEDGADYNKLKIIPNGINISNFENLKCGFDKDNDFFYVGFVGRIVNIKDVKTFIKSIKIVSEKIKNLKVLIMGPTDEEADYYNECVLLVKLLKLEKLITFTGKINVKEYYPGLDLIVLTSISEAQPLVILEANCVGVPCVASDVGACSELLYGRTEEDKNLGISGLITPVVSPEKTAEAIIKILSDNNLKKNMSKAAKKRVRKFYDEKVVTYNYFDLYREYINKDIGE